MIDINKPYKRIEGFEEYMVTEDGEVWSYKDKFKCRNGLRKLKMWKDRNGYYYVDCIDGDKKKRFPVHRLVATYFCEGYFENAVVNHIDANKTNNIYTNLEWITQKENIKKGYITSGVNQIRNYKIYYIVSPEGNTSCDLKGNGEVEKYIKENNLPIKLSMILKHKKHNGYNMYYRV